MRSFEYVTIEGQATRVPIVVCAGGAVVVRSSVPVRDQVACDSVPVRDQVACDSAAALGPTFTRDSAKVCDSMQVCDSIAAPRPVFAHDSADASFLARARKDALREFRAKLFGIINLFISNETYAMLRSQDRVTALKEVPVNAELRADADRVQIIGTGTGTGAGSTATAPNATILTSTTSAEFADQRIYANGS